VAGDSSTWKNVLARTKTERFKNWKNDAQTSHLRNPQTKFAMSKPGPKILFQGITQ
jgi:hypothetical protein